MFGELRVCDVLSACPCVPGRSLKSTWYWLTMIGLVCLPGCSGCESQTSPVKPPVATQSESKSASQEGSTEKQSDAEGRAAQDGSATRIQAAKGDVDSTDSVANADGEANPSSSAKGSSKSATGGDSAQGGSGTGSGNRGDGSPASGKTKSSGQAEKPSSPGEAVATAQTLKQRSDKAAAGKQYGQAFELATKAWESLQTFPKDAACSEMSSDLQRRMDELGTLANSQRGTDLKRDKPLIVR